MRKWMRDRLTRRKKTPAEASAQPAPPPLQPAYFDAEQQPGSTPDPGNIESEVSVPLPPAPEARPARRPRSRSAEPATEALPEAAADERSSEDGFSEEGSAEKRSTEALPQAELPGSPQPVVATSGQPGRGRRRRGGRGRGGRGREQAVAQAFAPAAVKGSVPGPPAEGGYEGSSDPREAEGQTPVAAAPRVPSIPAAPPRPPKGVVVLAI